MHCVSTLTRTPHVGHAQPTPIGSISRTITTTIQVYYMCERVEGVRWGVIGCEGVLDDVIGEGERSL